MKVAQACLTLCDPMDCIVHGILQARILEWVAFPFSRDLPNPGIKPRSPTLQVDSLPAEPQRKPKNTRVGSLSLLQWIFPTQKLNQGLLHCRWILYQLNYQGSPKGTVIIQIYIYMYDPICKLYTLKVYTSGTPFCALTSIPSSFNYFTSSCLLPKFPHLLLEY